MGRREQQNPGSLLTPLLGEPLWLPTRLLATEMSSKRAWRAGLFGLRKAFRPSEYFCMIARVFPESTPTESHLTISFIRELTRGIPPLETSLYRSVAAGKPISRHIGTSGERSKVQIRGQDEFMQYARRVLKLVELTGAQGIQPISSRADTDPNVARGKEGDIGIAMIDKELFFYRKGHHRLGAALALGIERIPCQCYFLSSSDMTIGDVDELKERTIYALRAIT